MNGLYKLTYIESTILISTLNRKVEDLEYNLKKYDKFGFKAASKTTREEIEALKALIEKLDDREIYYKK